MDPRSRHWHKGKADCSPHSWGSHAACEFHCKSRQHPAHSAGKGAFGHTHRPQGPQIKTGQPVKKSPFLTSLAFPQMAPPERGVQDRQLPRSWWKHPPPRPLSLVTCDPWSPCQCLAHLGITNDDEGRKELMKN